MEAQEEYTIISEAPPSVYPLLGIEIEEYHANLVVSFGPGTFFVQSVTAEQMNDIVHKWLSRHSKETHEPH